MAISLIRKKQLNNDIMAKTEQTVNVNSISRISAGTVIKGEIISPNDIRIDGTFEGKVTSKGRVVLGESAVVKGDIICIGNYRCIGISPAQFIELGAYVQTTVRT